MPSFSSLLTSLTGAGFYYEKSPRHATHNFNQEGVALYRNQPRVPFEFYININLNNVGTAGTYISEYFNSPSWAQVMPLVKSIEMPSMKIETDTLNQYNRKRVSQTKILYEPVKVVFHDVVDGKTLKFWEMYYRYYFADGTEPGMNSAKSTQQKNKTYSVEDLIHNITPTLNPNIANLPSSVKNLFQSNAPSGSNLPTNTLGDKSALQNIVQDSLDNHNFGFNLPTVASIRNLIQTIDIFQVHGGRFNQVTLVNPRIAAFTHDTLSYSESGKSLELTFTFEYEYAYYVIQNMRLGNPDNQINNRSSLEQFEYGETVELPALAFNATLLDFLESNNPLLTSDNPILQRIGKNTQAAIGTVTGSFLSNKVTRPISASVLNGLAQINPTPYYVAGRPPVQARTFTSTATRDSTAYRDVNRTGGRGG